jgi:hypothetical protein
VVDVGGSGDHRGARAAAAARTMPRHARDAGDDPGLASTSGRSAVDHDGDPATGSTPDPDRSADTGDTPGLAEPDMGIPPHPRRVGRPRPPGRGLHGLGDPQGRRAGRRAPPIRADLAAVPDRPGARASWRATCSMSIRSCCAAGRCSSPSSTPPAGCGSSARQHIRRVSGWLSRPVT